jgi:hypothetical protein
MLRRQKQASLVVVEKKIVEGWQKVTINETQVQSLNTCIYRSNVEQPKAKT